MRMNWKKNENSSLFQRSERSWTQETNLSKWLKGESGLLTMTDKLVTPTSLLEVAWSENTISSARCQGRETTKVANPSIPRRSWLFGRRRIQNAPANDMKASIENRR